MALFINFCSDARNIMDIFYKATSSKAKFDEKQILLENHIWGRG